MTPRYACVQCVATFDVTGHGHRPDLAVRYCPYCGQKGVLDSCADRPPAPPEAASVSPSCCA